MTLMKESSLNSVVLEVRVQSIGNDFPNAWKTNNLFHVPRFENQDQWVNIKEIKIFT